MRVVSIGGGPAGLYFAILMKKAFPDVSITVYERNRPDDTYGWGVVFSDETLSRFDEADPESYRRIQSQFRYWRDIEIHFGGETIVSTGHGFCALARRTLLEILQERCRELGVELEFEYEINSFEAFADADLILGADGVNSFVREQYAEHFGPSIDLRKCCFSWLGTDKPLEAFTFIFHKNEHGLFQVHAYPFSEKLSTWIVECHEDVWLRAGLDQATEQETVAYCERLFAPWLGGHRLLANRSIWRRFPTIRNESWHHENIVLLGDAAHTAHFSIGSGTKLAMEDAVALVDAFVEGGVDDVSGALSAYQSSRRIDEIKLQKAAQTSLEWFERSARYMEQHPLQLAFNLLTRSKRITYDNLAQRDPELVERVTEWYRVEVGAPLTSTGDAPPPIFTPFRLREMELANRLVVSPMCQYSAEEGLVGDWHLVHLGSRGIGGTGLLMTEMTDVSPEGRISPGCAGMYSEAHRDAWARIVEFVHRHSKTKIGIQLAHAGRKASYRVPWLGQDVPLSAKEGAWPTLAPSAIPFSSGAPSPREMNRADMDRIREAFVQATVWTHEAGFDLIEVHMAHGYLLSSFLSPLCNLRKDEYGGSLENRMRYPLEVFRAMREAWPEVKPMAVRISASDWMADGSGMTPADSVEVARALAAAGCDILDVSSGGNSIDSQPIYGRMYQVPFAEKIRYETGIPVMAVGALLGPDHANTVLAAGRADLAVMARPHLRDAYLTLHAAADYEYPDQAWPPQYLPGKPVLPTG